jgi:zinc-ribbon domain
MTYAYDLDNGQRLIVENDDDNTIVGLSSGDEGQQQSQSTGFTTGKWSKTPELFRSRGNLVLRVESKDGAQFIRIRGNQIQSMRSEPDLEEADRLKLKKSNESLAMEPMKPMEGMKPMEPMRPMKPMEPMKPMGSMRPMELRMGNMHMSMGSVEKEPQTAKRFCTQCGKPVQSDDRFCASCGHPLSGSR